MAKEINHKDLEQISGGNTRVNPNADGKGYKIDGIINSKNYEKIAEWFMKFFKLYPDRKRAVNNDVDVTDVDL